MVIWPPTTAAAAAFRLLSSRLRNVWHISRHFFSWKCHRQGESPFVKLSAVRAGARETKQRRKKLEGKEPANNRRTRNGTSQRFMAYHFFFRLHKTTDIAFPFWSVKKTTFYRPRTSETESTFEKCCTQDGRPWRFSLLRSTKSVKKCLIFFLTSFSIFGRIGWPNELLWAATLFSFRFPTTMSSFCFCCGRWLVVAGR